MRNCYLFAGPSLTAAARSIAQALGIRVLAPAVRSDVARLVATRRASVLVLADGRFHQAMSVGHAELRLALQRGWQVYGLSSIGAIRAYELREHGMRGYGAVYKLFATSADFQDDEVALLHGLDPPYRAGSEPLVHLRVALKAFVRRGLLDRAGAAAVVARLKSLWYGERTMELFEGLTLAACEVRDKTRLRAAMLPFDRFRIKQKDLAAFLATRSLS